MPQQKSLFRVIVEPLLVALILALGVRAVARICAVPSASMAPTLRPGDYIFVTRYLTDAPARGDIVVFTNPDGSGLTVKRIIALPGDLIDSPDGRVRLSGKLAAEPYAAGTTGPINPQLVPAAHFFVMGDHRSDSRDSRHWGPLPERLVVGRARIVLWSAGRGQDDRGERRIFKWIE